MQTAEKCYQRDKEIIRLVEGLRALDTQQIRSLLFPSETGLRKAQQRLRVLVREKQLHKVRLDAAAPTIYYRERYRQLGHIVAGNWFYIWLVKQLGPGEKLFHYEQEGPDLPPVRPDGFFGIEGPGGCKFGFLEVDFAESRNKFDKVLKYNKLYDSESWAGAWWVERARVFPTVYIVTDSVRRMAAISRKVQEENKSGLDFQILLLEGLKNGCCGK